jgi:hypothetical protein
MSDSTRVVRRLRSAQRAAARTAAVIIGTAALVLLATGCSGSGSSTGSDGSPNPGGSSSFPSALAYSACMRSHGLPNFPDPTSNGQVPKGDAQQFAVSTSQYQAAQQACQNLLPTGGSLQQQEHECMQNSDCPQAVVQQMLTADRELAQCMRSHGVPNFPDPTTDSHGPVFNITAAGISDAASHAHQFVAILDECGRLVGGNAPESFE